jgi:DNA-binding XRE family transcriptional regulator
MRTQKRLGNRLRAAIEERGLTQADVAILTGLSYAVVRRIVRDGYDPLLLHALRVGAVLGMPVEELFWLEDERPDEVRTREATVGVL